MKASGTLSHYASFAAPAPLLSPYIANDAAGGESLRAQPHDLHFPKKNPRTTRARAGRTSNRCPRSVGRMDSRSGRLEPDRAGELYVEPVELETSPN